MSNSGDSLTDQQRLSALGEKVRSAQDARKPVEQQRTGWGVGVRYASEFSAAVIVGGLFGFGVDKLASTTPWGLFAGLVLGFAAGIRNIIRAAAEMNAAGSADAQPAETKEGHDGS